MPDVETREGIEEALKEAARTLRYIAYGDILEGIRPSRPWHEAALGLARIERLLSPGAGER